MVNRDDSNATQKGKKSGKKQHRASRSCGEIAHMCLLPQEEKREKLGQKKYLERKWLRSFQNY